MTMTIKNNLKYLRNNLVLFLIIFGIGLYSCDSKPVKVEPISKMEKNEVKGNITGSNMQSSMPDGNMTNDNIHKVTVEDSLSTSRYVYLKVKEGARNYWISTWKMPFKKGDVFYYKDGILKLNFYSKEHNTYFDTLYLISKISRVPVFTKRSAVDKVNDKAVETAQSNEDSKLRNENIVSLKTLFSDPERFKGKVIKVHGICNKVNMNIMGKNWIHIKESNDSGKTYNLVVTTKDLGKIGEDCYFEGKIDTKLDLGAGYFFDVIMQEGKRIY